MNQSRLFAYTSQTEEEHVVKLFEERNKNASSYQYKSCSTRKLKIKWWRPTDTFDLSKGDGAPNKFYVTPSTGTVMGLERDIFSKQARKLAI